MAYEQPLAASEMERVLGDIMASRLPADEVKTFLTTLARRGETAEEIAAAVGVLRAHAVALPLAGSYELCDTCGTGGDGQGTLNVSTLAALVTAAAGVRVSKHGNRAASSRCGSADVLEALGVNLDATPAQVAACIEQAGFGFCFAPKFHPAMKAVGPIRRELKIRTLFNLVGPLANPATLTFQLVGVSDPRLMRPMAEALVRLNIRHGMVVHGSDGLDELTTTGLNDALEVQGGSITVCRIDPTSFGVPRATLEQLRGGDAADNARIAQDVLRGRPSPARDIVALNAGCAIYLAGVADTIPAGLAVAQKVLERGQALVLLEQIKELTRPNA